MLGAMVVFMSVQWTVASAALKPRFRHDRIISIVPAKGNGAAVHRPRFTAMPEAVIGGLLVAGSVTVYATNFYRFLEIDLFATVLLIQSLPFLSAVALVWLERFCNRDTSILVPHAG